MTSSPRLYIEDDPIRPIPEAFKDLPLGYVEVVKGEDLHVYSMLYNGKRVVLTRNQRTLLNRGKLKYSSEFWYFCSASLLQFLLCSLAFQETAEAFGSFNSLKAAEAR